MTPRCRQRNVFRHLLKEGADWLTTHQELTELGFAPCVVSEQANEVKRRAGLDASVTRRNEARTPILGAPGTAWRNHIFSQPHPYLPGRDWALHATKGWRVVAT